MMRDRVFTLLISTSILGLAACATMKNTGGGSGGLTLEEAEKIVPGVTTKEEITKRLGNPNRDNNLSEMPSVDDDGTIWLYLDNGEGRLTLYFKKNSTIVSSVGWHVRKGEREENLEAAKNRLAARFKNVNFHFRDKPWQEDEIGFEAAYEDPTVGAAILIHKGNEEVTGMTWSDPVLFAQMAKKWIGGRMSCHHGNDCVWINAAGKQTRTITSPEKN